MRRRPRPRTQGLVILDAMIGLMLLAAMLVALSTAFAQHRRVAETLAAQRAAVRTLEAAAIELEAGLLRFREHSMRVPGVSRPEPIFQFPGFGVVAIQHESGWIELRTGAASGEQSLFLRLTESVMEAQP